MNLNKGEQGWRARSIFTLEDLGDKGIRVLILSTSKRLSGFLCTSVSVSVSKDGFDTHRVYQDYNKQLARTHARCTEKNVKEQHALCENDIQTYIYEAKARYAAKEIA